MSKITYSVSPLSSGHYLPSAPPVVLERSLTPAQWGMLAFLASEVSFFSTLIVVYRVYLGAAPSGPTPAVLSLPLVIVTTLCLLSSSVTIHLAMKSLSSGQSLAFVRWWSATILLGIAFLSGTAYEWHELVVVHDLTPSRNLFGTTYYTLVGFHALHVTIGVVVMLIVLGLALCRLLRAESRGGVELVSWYWHFVDVVWIVVFTVVYLAGR